MTKQSDVASPANVFSRLRNRTPRNENPRARNRSPTRILPKPGTAVHVETTGSTVHVESPGTAGHMESPGTAVHMEPPGTYGRTGITSKGGHTQNRSRRYKESERDDIKEGTAIDDDQRRQRRRLENEGDEGNGEDSGIHIEGQNKGVRCRIKRKGSPGERGSSWQGRTSRARSRGWGWKRRRDRQMQR